MNDAICCIKMEKSMALFRPKLVVAGASAYPRLYDYARMRRVRLDQIMRFA
jgi:glycine/serine hydroxymethyltransferase